MSYVPHSDADIRAMLATIGAKSLDELPASDVLSSRQIDDWLQTSANPHRPNDTDMGLSDEQLPLQPSAIATKAVEPVAPEVAASAVQATPEEPPTQN